jgi:hypothetical protein
MAMLHFRIVAMVAIIVCLSGTGLADEGNTGTDAMIGTDDQGRLYLRDGDQRTILLSQLIEFFDMQTQTLAELRDQVSLLSAAIANKSATIIKLQEENLVMRTALEVVNSTAAAAGVSLTSVSRNVTDISTRVSRLENDSNSNSAQTAAQSQLLAALTSNLTRVSDIAANTVSEVAALQPRVAVLEGQVNGIEQQLRTTTSTTSTSSTSTTITFVNNNDTREWVQLLGGSKSDFGFGIATDNAGSVYITGYTVNGTALPGNNVYSGGTDIVVAKFASNGTREWVTLLGGSGSEFGQGIATDSAGSVYIIGYTTNGTALPDNNVHSGGSDMVVAKFSNNGTRKWVQLLGGAGDDYGQGIAIDSNDSIYITGYTTNSTALPGSSSTHSGGFDIVVVKFASNGTREWVQLLGGSGDDYGQSIATDSTGSVYITGYTTNGTALPGSNAHSGFIDMVVAKFSSNGTLEWVKPLGGSGDNFGLGIATDRAGSVYITGYTTNGTALSSSTSYSGSDEMVIAKFASNGTREWVKLFGGSGSDVGQGIVTDSTGSVLVSGRTTNGTALPGSSAYSGGNDMVVAKFSSNGTREWVRLLGGSGNDVGFGIATDSAGSVYITGYSSSTSLPGSGVNSGNSDIVVAKLT